MKIGIMGAMPQEVELVKSAMEIEKVDTIGGRNFVSGTLHGFETVLVFSRWGKVASASTATTLFNVYNVDFLLFTGVAGAVDPILNIGDIVIGNKLYQHDMDASPLFPKFHIPLTETMTFSPTDENVANGEAAARKYVSNIETHISRTTLNQFSIFNPKVMAGTIASGDQFVTNTLTHASMHLNADEKAHAVEMEGAAVAQVCEDYKKPYLIIRTISDKADHSASIDFGAFIENVSNHYSSGIVFEFLEALRASIAQTTTASFAKLAV